MLKSQIEVGGKYTAKISGRLVTVRVDAIREVSGHKRGPLAFGARSSTLQSVYDVTNLTTKRTTTFKSAAKFRSVARLIES